MAKKLLGLVLIAIVYLTFSNTASAEELKDGTYTVKYEVLKGGESSVSIANDYFLKPAKLIVKDGKHYVEITVAKSHWVTKLTMNKKTEVLVSKDKKKDQRHIQFPVNKIVKPQQSTVDVYINEKVDGEDFLYDNSYEIQFQFDEKSIKKISDTPAEVKVKTDVEKPKKADKKESNNVTKYITYALFVIVFAAIVIIIGRQIKGRKN